ncbi:MAG TPA: DUF3821 domain-containing protein, partial [Methanoregula sp.]|nr:DUF3821 domain-containing protein [Methanoregula sp.]
MKSRSLIFVISGIILLCLLLPTVSASTRTIIHPGAEVFIGEQQLNISATIIGTDAYIAWWASAADINITAPSKTMDVSLTKDNFFVSSSDFVGYTGSWYSYDGTGSGSSGWAFNVSDPQLGAVQIWDFSTTSDATDRAVARGDLLGFNITTNMYTHTNGHRSNAPGDVDANMKIRVKDPTSATYTSLDNDALVPQPLTQLVVGTQPWAWNGATVNMWATGAAPGGLFEYQP